MDPIRSGVTYGPHPSQVVEFTVPCDPTGAASPSRTTVILIHGGFWQAGYDLRLEDAVVEDLVGRGFVVANLDYRAMGDGGGWPQTFADVAQAIDTVADWRRDRNLSGPVVIVGHSAGGHLALWAAARHQLPSGAIGADPRLRPTAVVSQAGVTDLDLAHRLGLGRSAVAGLLGVAAGADLDIDLLTVTSPLALVPLGVPTLLVTGDRDDRVPPTLSERYQQRAEAVGDPATLLVVPGDDHFAHLDPTSRSWVATAGWITAVADTATPGDGTG
ncbi:MAG: alpha/beta hydrolase family protein [Acidimicrobiales bacterium]